MSKLTVSVALRSNPRVRALAEGEVQPEGIDLISSVLPPADVFWRQLRFGEFDVSEMSLSSLLISTAAGDDRWVALPVFPDRRFFHVGIMVRADAGIERAQDLRGKRVGVPDYQQTAALWARGALQHEFDVSPRDIHWFMERTTALSHGGATGFSPPDGVTVEFLGPERSQRQMLLSGELDASIIYIAYPTLIDRSRGDLPPERVRTLFRDPHAEMRRYHPRLGFVPMNHCMVVRRELVDRHPWVVTNLFMAFVRAKQLERERATTAVLLNAQLGLVTGVTDEGYEDLFPYGLAPNRVALETLASYSYEQGLVPEKVDPSRLFAESVLDLVG